MKSDPIVIVSAARTPMGSFQGSLNAASATQLGATAIEAVIKRAAIDPQLVSEALMGCVLTAGLGQAPARQAAIHGGLPESTPCTTVGKVCGSGMKAVMFAHDAIVAGSAEIAVAGGMESMSNAPYLMRNGRSGYRMGHAQIFDHMMLDGLEDAYEAGRSMGTFGEDCAAKYGFTREAQDAYAMRSVTRAQQSLASGVFKEEIAPVKLSGRSGDTFVDIDEGPGRIVVDKIPTLRPAFRKDGTITAASSSSLSDGAAALMLMRESQAGKLGCTPLARIVGHATHAQAPAWFSTAPIPAISKLLDRCGWQKDDVDLFEINEAFAVVTMAAIHDLDLDPARVNVRGGACALGHPIGASGARLIVTLLHALKQGSLKRGVASLCIGGGEATAIALECYCVRW